MDFKLDPKSFKQLSFMFFNYICQIDRSIWSWKTYIYSEFIVSLSFLERNRNCPFTKAARSIAMTVPNFAQNFVREAIFGTERWR